MDCTVSESLGSNFFITHIRANFSACKLPGATEMRRYCSKYTVGCHQGQLTAFEPRQLFSFWVNYHILHFLSLPCEVDYPCDLRTLGPATFVPNFYGPIP